MEKCVMNNYFGIGLDAKISLEFNNKREEHPEKCRSDVPPFAFHPSPPPSSFPLHRRSCLGHFRVFSLTKEVHQFIVLFVCCRSRTKNMMWYGVLGTKELLQRTYKNLEQKVQLEVRTFTRGIPCKRTCTNEPMQEES